ncbi:unnamed protein product [Brassica rapa subsp. narinosa]
MTPARTSLLHNDNGSLVKALAPVGWLTVVDGGGHGSGGD